MVSTFSNMYFIRIYYNYRKPDRTHKILPYFNAVRNYDMVCSAIFDSTLIKTS